MIEIGMHKIYKNFGYKQVLKDINFEILTGDRVGIVGKNGSGKSTLFKMIMKKEFPDTGNITIRKQATIGYLEQIPTISDNDITVKDMLMSSFFEIHAIEQRMRALEQDMMHNNVDEAILNKYAKIQDQYIALGGYEVEEKLNKVITGFKLHSILDKPFAILSGGQKTIINLAQLILTEPDILLLDEPFNGLDPIGIKEFRDLLIELSQKGVGIVISSHSLEELSKLVDTVTIINQGKVIFQGKKTEFLSLGSINNVWLLKTDNIELTKSILNNLNIVFTERIEQLELSLDIESMKEVKEKLLTELLRQDISIINFSEKQNNFEDIFIKMQRDMEV